MGAFHAKQMLLGKDILLESGTNELEVLVFFLDGGQYGVNVAKVREVIVPVPVHRMPETHPSVEGAFRLRERVVPLIGLRHHLGMTLHTEEQLRDTEGSRIIVTEFNQQTNGFRVDAVEQIHRVSWEQIQPMPRIPGSEKSPVTAIAKINDVLVPMLDFEMIIDHISRINQLRTGPVQQRFAVDRGSKRIALAEDSATVQELMHNSLTSSGYVHVELFTNGKDLWEWLLEQAESGSTNEKIDIVVSDIEMPQIDGLHLTKRIREHAVLKDLPVILFSSLITEDNVKKCQAVGATAQISKPELHRLVDLIDQTLGEKIGSGAGTPTSAVASAR